MPKLTARRVVLGMVAAVLLVSFIPPLLNVNRYRADVASAIGRAVGREVSVGGVSLRMFPQPGFALSNFVVADDPSFSAEPMILAQEVTANLRLSSLWRGRLEIASLSLSYPSLNLVRRRDGNWNVESLLERATRSETAPTATKPESRPRFPYIEAEGGRINLKLGQEKKAYALSSADFALWLASEREWRLRLTAQPMRTDDNLSDTGMVRLSGSFGSAPELMNTPLALTLTLERAQLGQFTRLIYGFDGGWRGAVDATFALRGSPANLTITAQAAVDDLHRYDVYDANGLRLATRCTARVSATMQELRDVECSSALGSGTIEATGEARWVSANPNYNLKIAARELPAELLLGAARRMEKDLSRNLNASGLVDATFEFSSSHDNPSGWRGSGTALDLVIESAAITEPLQLRSVHFALDATPAQAEVGRTLHVAPVAVPLGGTRAATAQAWLSRSGYRVTLQGEADAARALSLARALAIPAPPAEVSGLAQMDLELADTWAGEASPVLSGSARLKNVTASIDGLNSSLLIASGRLMISPSRVLLQNASFSLPELALKATGWVRKPRMCALTASSKADSTDAGAGTSATPCLLEFSLAADQIDAAKLERALAPPRQRRPWYRFSRNDTRSPLMNLHASGTLRAAAIEGGALPARRLRVEVQWAGGILQLKQLQADVWQGQHRGDVRADFSGSSPSWEWSGELRQASLREVTEPADEEDSATPPATEGRMTLRGTLKASGLNATQVRASTTGSLQVDIRNGVLPRLALDGEGGPLRVRRLHGEIEIQAGEITISRGELQTGDERYEVSGEASLAQELKLRLSPAGQPVATSSEMRASQVSPQGILEDANVDGPASKELWITGTLEDPSVQEVSAAQATSLPASASKNVVKGAKEARSRVASRAGTVLAPANSAPANVR